MVSHRGTVHLKDRHRDYPLVMNTVDQVPRLQLRDGTLSKGCGDRRGGGGAISETRNRACPRLGSHADSLGRASSRDAATNLPCVTASPLAARLRSLAHARVVAGRSPAGSVVTEGCVARTNNSTPAAVLDVIVHINASAVTASVSLLNTTRATAVSSGRDSTA